MSYLQVPLGWGWSGLNTPLAGMSLMAAAQPNLKQGSLQASLWDTGSKNSQWKESWALRCVRVRYCGCTYLACVQMWLCCEYVSGCVGSPCILCKNCQLQMVERGQRDGGVSDSSRQGASHFHFVHWKPSVKLWWRAICISGWLWRGRLCSLPSKSRARTLPAPKPAHPTTNRHPPSALHPPPSWHYFSTASASGYSTIVLHGQEHLLGVLSSTLSGVFQSDPRVPPTTQTRKIISGDTGAENMCQPRHNVETSQKHHQCLP